ncbi:hypothetical protein AYX13_05499, partial [Cryptococcus neoformans]
WELPPPPPPPRPLLAALQKRLHASTAHLNALADIYKQRAAIEAAYADGLHKLARTAEQGGLTGKAGNDWPRGSGEDRLWDSVLSELAETSASHSTLSAMLRTDFEQPIREIPTKVVAWRRIGDQDSNLDKTLRDYEKVSAKLEKASSKSSKSAKADALRSDIQNITQALSSLSPMVYTTYQRLDEERLRALKEIIVRWATVKGDMASRDGQRAETIVSHLLQWETGDEVMNVGRKLGAIGGGRVPERSASVATSATTPQSNRRLSTAASHTAAHGDFSPRPPASRANGSSTNNVSQGTPSSSFTGGFKSMLARSKTVGGGRNRGESDATSTRSATRGDNFEAIGEEAPKLRESTTTAPPVDEEGFSVAPSDRHRNPWEDPNELVPTPAGQTAQAQAQLQAPVVPTKDAHAAFSQPFDASPSASDENLASPTSLQQPFKNLSLAPVPIQESEEERRAALEKMQKTLQLPPSQPSRRSTIARGRRDVRNTMFAGSSTSTDEATAASNAVFGTGASVLAGGLTNGGLSKSAELEEKLVDSPTSTKSPIHTTGGGAFSHDIIPSPSPIARRTSLSSVTSNNPFDSPTIGIGGTMTPPPINGAAAADQPGLRANVNESVNVIFRNKQVQRIHITGEIHLTLRGDTPPSPSQPPHGPPIHIRLAAFEHLEKIAPNPAYLAQVPDKPGEYFLNPQALAAATARAPPPGSAAASGAGPLLFKYVVHVQPGKELATVPLILDPVFQCKSGETRMILHYSVNPSSPLQLHGANGNGGATVVAAFAPGGPSVSNVQAKPAGGVWSPSTRRMTWKMDSLFGGGGGGGANSGNSGDGEKGKIIAKFTSEPGQEALVPQVVQMSWAVEGSLISGLGLEVVNGGGGGELEGEANRWVFEEIRKSTTTGKYLAEPVVSS